MNYTISKCKNCNEEKLIVNKRHSLCKSCNSIRLGKPEPKNYFLKRTPLKPSKKRMKMKTVKQSVTESMLRGTYAYIDENRDRFCAGCGRVDRLSHSHIIRQSKCKALGMSELIYDKKNIAFHCLSYAGELGCHDIWESGSLEEKQKMLDFESNLEYVRSKSEQQYQFIIQ